MSDVSVNDPVSHGPDPYRATERRERLEKHVFRRSELPERVWCPTRLEVDEFGNKTGHEHQPCGSWAPLDLSIRPEPGPNQHTVYVKYRCTECGRLWPVLSYQE